MVEDGRSLGEDFMQVARALRRGYAESLTPLGLTPHEARALRVIGEHQPTRLGVVAQHLRIAPRSVTDVVDALEESGLVRRASDPDDRRAVLVSLSPRGRRLLATLEQTRRRSQDELFARLSERDRATLARILGLVMDTNEGKTT